MITTEQKKKLMIYLGYEYFPWNAEKHQLKPFLTQGYWFKYPSIKEDSPLSVFSKNKSHEFYYTSKIWQGKKCVVKKLWDFNTWGEIMFLVKKMNEDDLVWASCERGFNLPDKLAAADMEGTLNTIIEILTEFSMI